MEDCIFCKIIKGEIPTNLVYEGEGVIAIRDINPQAPQHYLVMPKKHFENITDIPNEAQATLSEMFKAIKTLAEEKGMLDSGFRTVINQGSHGGQVVPHLHIHVLGGRPMGWPPG